MNYTKYLAVLFLLAIGLHSPPHRCWRKVRIWEPSEAPSLTVAVHWYPTRRWS